MEKLQFTSPDFSDKLSIVDPVVITYNVPELTDNCTGLGMSGSTCLSLTFAHLTGIFNGTITYWNDPLLVQHNPALEGVNESIVVIVRADDAGTTSILTRAFAENSRAWNTTHYYFSEGCNKTTGLPLKWNSSLNYRCGAGLRGVASLVLQTPYSVGYMGKSDAVDFSLPHIRLRNAAGFVVHPSSESVEAAMNASIPKLSNVTRLSVSLLNQPGNRSYPLSAYTYFIMPKHNITNCTMTIELHRWLRYSLTDPLGRNVVRDFHKAPLNAKILEFIEERFFRQAVCAGKKVYEMLEYEIDLEEGRIGVWKLPVAIVLSLFAAFTLVFCTILAVIYYSQNKHAVYNSFVISLDKPDAGGKSQLSMGEPSIFSETDQMVTDWEGLGYQTKTEVVYQHPRVDTMLLRSMCDHIAPLETMRWRTRVTLVRLCERTHHENILRLIGISMYNGEWKYVMKCPAKGVLQTMLRSGKIHLNNVFRYSLAIDIANGMDYLHRHGIVHGQLTSLACYIDARWSISVGQWYDYSMHSAQKGPFHAFEAEYFTAKTDHSNNKTAPRLAEYYKLLFWSAPELLQRDTTDMFTIRKPTKKGDVYSFSVVVYELFTDTIPYEDILTSTDKKTKRDAGKILNDVVENDMRPVISTELTMTYKHIDKLIRSSWDKNPQERKSFHDLYRKLNKLRPKGYGPVDAMMKALEEYSTMLEERIEEKNRDYETVAKNMENLLNSMLPQSVAAKLAQGKPVEPEYFDSCSILFADIVDFARITASLSPQHTTNLLNTFYSAVEDELKNCDVYKADSTGDLYMFVSGAPVRNGNKHVGECATLALDMMFLSRSLVEPHMPEKPLRLRAGIHTGPVIGCIIGNTVPRYCFFGDTIQMTILVKNTSLPNQIQVSGISKYLLDSTGHYEMVSRGLATNQGDGPGVTYWLLKKEGHPNPIVPLVEAAAGDVAIHLFPTVHTSETSLRSHNPSPRGSPHGSPRHTPMIARSPSGKSTLSRDPSRLSINQGAASQSRLSISRQSSRQSILSRHSSGASLVAVVPPVD
ncbi:receptor-type guanylate cyclase gcy-4-like isoform X2 [Paramacrobiotus metropolitanus]|uniref:receptor-type guanylate cyclase gcy-4-like isoform X2 n=1 Tax=Paramacrobiotus metropolitanus TaxID=2943436 RepID=UPI0024456D89|nr:receptor-type guanylate cyclase gcy-4-like isoform X2 [Paramacrobiotus metropolitanus]